MVIYDDAFNLNEWFVIISLTILLVAVWFTPKIFTIKESIVYFIYGFFVGMFYDHTLSVKPWDFYDVNDRSAYEVTDFLSYIAYGPHSYFFVYLYVKLKISGFKNILFISVWLAFAILYEWIAIKVGIFHYAKGFSMYWSVSTYLLAQLVLIGFYYLIEYKKNNHLSMVKQQGNSSEK